MSSDDLSMQVVSLRLDEDGSQATVSFELENTETTKLYDFVKLFIGSEYIGLKYLDIPAGQTRSVAFRFDPSAISGAPDLILTGGDREDGVLFREPLREIGGTDILDTTALEQQAEPDDERNVPDTTWDRLQEEYQDLIHQPSQTQTDEQDAVMDRLAEEHAALQDQEEKKDEKTSREPLSTEKQDVGAETNTEPQEQQQSSEETKDQQDIEVRTLDDIREEEKQQEPPATDDQEPAPEPTDRQRNRPPEQEAEPIPSPDADEEPVSEPEPAEPEQEQQNLLQSVVGSVFGSDDQPPEATSQGQEAVQEEFETEQQDEETEELGQEDRVGDELLPSEKVRRRSTGIKGLDEKMQGGLVDGTMNLVTGKTGTGKTAFCANFLRRGAELDEPGVYVTTEEREADIKADIESMFGWDFGELEDQGKVKILSIKPVFPSKEIENLNRLVRSYISNLLDQVMEAVDEIEAERVIIDSVSIIEMFIRDEYMARVALASLLNKLREAEVTALMTGTVPETSEGLSGGGIIEFLVDTVLLLEFVPVAEEYSRTLTIRKMRRTDHDVEIFPFEISPDGIKLHEVE